MTVAQVTNLNQHHETKTHWEKHMSLNRRNVLKGALAAGVATSTLKVPAAVAQPGPIKVGFLTVKSGALASGGLQMEQGMTTFFKQRNNMLGGRPVELQTADTGGNPAQARTKTQELVERFGVHCIIGPLAAFEALAIDDFIRSSKTPNLTVAGAEDITQRGAQVPDAVTGLSVEQVDGLLETLSRIHAPFWDSPRLNDGGDLSWLNHPVNGKFAEFLRAWRVEGSQFAIAQTLRPRFGFDAQLNPRWGVSASGAWSSGRGFHAYDNVSSSVMVTYSKERLWNHGAETASAAYPMRISFGLEQQTFYDFPGQQHTQIVPSARLTF